MSLAEHKKYFFYDAEIAERDSIVSPFYKEDVPSQIFPIFSGSKSQIVGIFLVLMPLIALMILRSTGVLSEVVWGVLVTSIISVCVFIATIVFGKQYLSGKYHLENRAPLTAYVQTKDNQIVIIRATEKSWGRISKSLIYGRGQELTRSQQVHKTMAGRITRFTKLAQFLASTKCIDEISRDAELSRALIVKFIRKTHSIEEKEKLFKCRVEFYDVNKGSRKKSLIIGKTHNDYRELIKLLENKK